MVSGMVKSGTEEIVEETWKEDMPSNRRLKVAQYKGKENKDI